MYRIRGSSPYESSANFAITEFLRSSIAEVCLATFGRRARSYKSRQGTFSSLYKVGNINNK